MLAGPRQLAVAALAMLFVYYEVYRWVPLGRWNGQFRFPVVNDQFYPDLVIGALLIWFVISFARASRPGMITSCVLLGFWVVVHFFDWWLPYLRDLPSNAARYSFYASRTQLLPVVGRHYPPDAGHAILDFIVYPAWFIVLWATLTNVKRPRHA